MDVVRRKSNASEYPASSAEKTNNTERAVAVSPELSCEKSPPLSSGGLLPLSRLEQLPAAFLAYEVGDLLEFDERSDLGEASKKTRAAMALGTNHPLYAQMYAEQAAYRQLAVGVKMVDKRKLARKNVNDDRAKREKAERTRAGYANARKTWARTVQKDFAANPRDVTQIGFAADLAGELGRVDLAVKVLRWGLEQFPAYHSARLQLAEVLLQARPPTGAVVLPDPTTEAITEASILKRLNPMDPKPRVVIARALLLQARDLSRTGNDAGGHAALAAALAELREEPAVTDPLTLAMIEHSLGHEPESAAALKTYLDGRRGRPMDAKLAEVYAWRGEPKLAVECLERILERNIHDHGLCQVAHSRFMDDIHDDKRWLPLLSRMNRAPDQLAAVALDIQLPGDA